MLAQVVFAIVAIVAVAFASPGSDPFTGHCAKSCASLKNRTPPKGGEQLKLISRREANPSQNAVEPSSSSSSSSSMNEMPAIFVEKIIRKYQTYSGCMNDCMCAAYCTVLEELADWSIESCAPVCRRAKPYSTGDKFFKEMENSLNAGAF